jgi:probable rRNA maturation factor
MSLAVDVSADDVRASVGRGRVAEIARTTLKSERVRDALLSITFVSRRAIARLNRTHLDHRGPTDVISFGFVRATPDDPVIGDIYICPDIARANARAHRTPVREEMARLIVHGVLHVLGHDHPEGDEVVRERSGMWRKQERIVRRVAGAARG